jgi:hypothetical protein
MKKHLYYDETVLTQAGVVSISYGEERTFRIRYKKNQENNPR